MNTINESQLGKKTQYTTQYAPELLFPISRSLQRTEINIATPLPFYGYDIWNAYELSWLNNKGKPIVAIGEFILPCNSPNIIESKSMKLYLNSLNNTKFQNIEIVLNTIKKDLSEMVGTSVEVNIQMLSEVKPVLTHHFDGHCIDALDITTDKYNVNADLLTTEEGNSEETLYSDLLRSNCLVTAQPDWASVQIHYRGKKINHENLLKYIISCRNNLEFHEPCVERIFIDIMRRCKPDLLTVEARYTRRGGLDINPIRSTSSGITPRNHRQPRQ